MHCKEVIYRINKNLPPDESGEMLRHLERCPNCARAYQAEQKLHGAFRTVKENNENLSTPLSSIRHRVNERSESATKESIMSKIKYQANLRPGLLVGLSLAVFVFLFVTLVPFSYTTTVGYELTCTMPTGNINISLDNLGKAMNAVGLDDVSVVREDNVCIIGSLPDKTAARKASIVFTALTGTENDYDIRPIVGTVSGSLFAQAINKYTVEVETTGKSDSEIAEEIRQQLTTSGIADAQVNVSTIGGDEYKIDISSSSGGPDSGTESESVIELKLKSGEDKISFDAPESPGTPEDLNLDFENMTDAEIKDAVEAKLAAEGKEGANVEVITRADGKREINVSFEKEETR